MRGVWRLVWFVGVCGHRVGARLPSELIVIDPCPYLPLDDLLNVVPISDAVHVGDLLIAQPLAMEYSDYANVILGEPRGDSNIDAAKVGAVPTPIINVRRVGIVPEVRKVIILWVSILVAYFHALGRWADEREHDDPMDSPLSTFKRDD